MWQKFLKLFKRPRIVIEVKAPLPTIDKSATEAIKTLQYHSGFIELMNRLRIQRAYLETTLKRDPKADMNSLQHGIYWSEYWEREVGNAINKHSASVSVEATQDVLAEFNKINGAIERIGLSQ
jgi:hypothetical protein